MNELLDTNVILRFLVGDNASQQTQARHWFQEAESGKRTLIIQPLVIAESCFLLESVYKKNREEIATSFEVMLSQRWIDVVDRVAMLGLWRWYRDGFHFVDSYLLALAKTNTATILTFDKKLQKSL